METDRSLYTAARSMIYRKKQLNRRGQDGILSDRDGQEEPYTVRYQCQQGSGHQICKPEDGKEKDAWENAKRLAAILYIAVEDYGETNTAVIKEGDREDDVVRSGDMESYSQIIDFIEQQEDSKGEPIINEIGKRENFRAAWSTSKDKEGAVEKGGNVFF